MYAPTSPHLTTTAVHTLSHPHAPPPPPRSDRSTPRDAHTFAINLSLSKLRKVANELAELALEMAAKEAAAATAAAAAEAAEAAAEAMDEGNDEEKKGEDDEGVNEEEEDGYYQRRLDSGDDDEGDHHYGAGAGGGSDAAPAVSYKESVLTYLLKVRPSPFCPCETHHVHVYLHHARALHCMHVRTCCQATRPASSSRTSPPRGRTERPPPRPWPWRRPSSTCAPPRRYPTATDLITPLSTSAPFVRSHLGRCV